MRYFTSDRGGPAVAGGGRAITSPSIHMMLRRARKAARLTQAEVARRMGTTQSVISRAESLTGPDPGIKFLERFAFATGQELVPVIGGQRCDTPVREGLAECRRLRRLALRVGCRWISAIEPAMGETLPDVVVRMLHRDDPVSDQTVGVLSLAARRVFCSPITLIDIDSVKDLERRTAIFRRRRNLAAAMCRGAPALSG